MWPTVAILIVVAHEAAEPQNAADRSALVMYAPVKRSTPAEQHAADEHEDHQRPKAVLIPAAFVGRWSRLRFCCIHLMRLRSFDHQHIPTEPGRQDHRVAVAASAWCQLSVHGPEGTPFARPRGRMLTGVPFPKRWCLRLWEGFSQPPFPFSFSPLQGTGCLKPVDLRHRPFSPTVPITCRCGDVSPDRRCSTTPSPPRLVAALRRRSLLYAFSYPIWRGVEITAEGKTQMVSPEFQDSRSQDLKKVYHDAGQWYWMKMEKIHDSDFIQNKGSIVLSEMEAQDIDDLTDWKLAEIKFKLLHENKVL